MIDKNFYLENLSAFDILIQDEDRKQAEVVIFRVYSMLQRDKIWLREVATEEEIFEEDAELLEEVELEMKELDEQYDFQFDKFYQLVQQEMQKLQSKSEVEIKNEDDFYEIEFDSIYDESELEVGEDEDFYGEEDDGNNDVFNHLSDEEIDLVPEYILASAKTRFNYQEFLETFPITDESFVEEEFLFPVIAGKAFGETNAEIAEKILSNFLIAGYESDENNLLIMIAEKGKALGLEILAFKIASDSLNEGAHPTAVIQQIAPLLGM